MPFFNMQGRYGNRFQNSSDAPVTPRPADPLTSVVVLRHSLCRFRSGQSSSGVRQHSARMQPFGSGPKARRR
jgi:hypothetical protein